MAASKICPIRINKIAFTKQDLDEVANEHDINFPHIMSSLEWS